MLRNKTNRNFCAALSIEVKFCTYLGVHENFLSIYALVKLKAFLVKDLFYQTTAKIVCKRLLIIWVPVIKLSFFRP